MECAQVPEKSFFAKNIIHTGAREKHSEKDVVKYLKNNNKIKI